MAYTASKGKAKALPLALHRHDRQADRPGDLAAQPAPGGLLHRLTGGISRRLLARYLDVVASIYIFNEHRGYTSLDRVLEALRQRHPEARDFIAAVEKHRADERRHYAMFKGWFERQGRMPLAVDKTCAHIDRMIRLTFGCDIDGLDTKAVVASAALFERLCRVIILTEQRGVRQVDIMLAMPVILRDTRLRRIFRVIERDEPSHWQPYDAWLRAHGTAQATRAERLADWWVHKSLVLVKLPLLFLNPLTPRRKAWHDAGEAVNDALAFADSADF